MKFICLSFFILAFLVLNGQNPERIYQTHTFEDDKLTIDVSDGQYQFRFYDNEILEAAFVPTGENYSAASHAVVMKPVNTETKITEDKNKLSFGTLDLTLEVIFKPFQIKYFYQGKEMLSEKSGYYKSSHQPLEMVRGNIVANETEKLEFNLTADEVLYGAGARALPMNRRGYRLPLFNRAHYGYETHSELMNYTMPIVVSSKKYLLHFDNAPTGYIDFDSQQNNTLTYETISGRKTYQLVVGESWENLVQNYTELTGRQPMLPRWALGNFSSRFGYRSQNQTVETIEKFREEEIPVDAVILDLYWFGKEVQGPMGNLKFEKDSFPKPEKMIRELRRNNVETVLITEPFILTTSDRWQEAVKNKALALNSAGEPYTYDFFFGNTGLVDIYAESGYNWFRNIYEDLIDMGVTGIWGDLGEPEVHPSDLIHATGTAQEVHNIYGHDWARLVQEAFHSSSPQLRPFILMRAAYSGSQRFGIIPWTGDVNRTWGGLQSQPGISLGMGLQGIGYMHSDLGGFAGANLDDELYVRWLQYGVFQPIYRPHAQEDVPSEPVFRSEKAKALAAKAIELRYRMLPYNYTLMYENSVEGKPLMRPLFFEEPENSTLQTYTSAYLWGANFLVSPVLEKGQISQSIYFPKTSDWIDYYDGTRYSGGSKAEISLNEEYIPVFVRSGSVVPMAPLMQSTKEYNGDTIIFHYYYDSEVNKSESVVYNDDGKTNGAHSSGAYEILELETSLEDRNEIKIKLTAESGNNFKSRQKQISIYIHNLDRTPKLVNFGNGKIPVKWNNNAKTLKLELVWDTSSGKELNVHF